MLQGRLRWYVNICHPVDSNVETLLNPTPCYQAEPPLMNPVLEVQPEYLLAPCAVYNQLIRVRLVSCLAGLLWMLPVPAIQMCLCRWIVAGRYRNYRGNRLPHSWGRTETAAEAHTAGSGYQPPRPAALWRIDSEGRCVQQDTGKSRQTRLIDIEWIIDIERADIKISIYRT